MKKALAFIFACFVFASIFFKSIPAKASDFAIPESGWLPVIYDIFYSLVNGNEINVAELAGELSGISAVIDKYDEYRNTHFDTGVESALSFLNNSLFTYALSMYEGDLYDLAAQYSVYLKDGTYPLLGRYTKDRIARWNQYNTQFNDLYLDNFAQENQTTPVYPDQDYAIYLNNINLKDSSTYNSFWFYNFPLQYAPNQNVVYYLRTNPITNYSWISMNINNNNFSTSGFDTFSILADDILDINITSNNSVYSYSVSGTGISNFIENSAGQFFSAARLSATGSDYTGYRLQWYNPNSLNYSYSYSSEYLSTIFADIALHFRNVNIYVDGVAWSIVGETEIEDFITGPDVIRNDNGLIDSQDVFVPDQELAFDLIGLINLLEDKLNNLEDLTFDDLITDGIILNPDGTALEDARSHILDMTIQRVIADEQERDDPEPVATITPPPYPTFPEVDWRKNPIPEPLPTGFDTSNGNPSDAFSGASTLAQIVDATNRGLPSELVYTFWGIVFGMIVLGIIKVLHK